MMIAALHVHTTNAAALSSDRVTLEVADVFAPLDLDDDCDSACTTNAAALSSDRVTLEVADVFAPLDLDDD